MSIVLIVCLVLSFGALGGLVNCALSGEFVLPSFDPQTRIWRPGWVGNVLIGAVAALVVWGVYGPAGSLDLVHPNEQELRLTIAQLLSSIVVGLSGGKILTTIAERNAEQFAKAQLAASLRDLVGK